MPQLTVILTVPAMFLRAAPPVLASVPNAMGFRLKQAMHKQCALVFKQVLRSLDTFGIPSEAQSVWLEGLRVRWLYLTACLHGLPRFKK